MTFAGTLTFNPMTDALLDSHNRPFRFQPPSGTDLPSSGFASGDPTYQPPPPTPTPDPSVAIRVDPVSTRLQLLEPFAPWNGDEFSGVRVLVKVKGKCTTDHISAAGPWLKFKGHLENIAENTLIGAMSAENGKVNVVRNVISGGVGFIYNLIFIRFDLLIKALGYFIKNRALANA